MSPSKNRESRVLREERQLSGSGCFESLNNQHVLVTVTGVGGRLGAHSQTTIHREINKMKGESFHKV